MAEPADIEPIDEEVVRKESPCDVDAADCTLCGCEWHGPAE